jgi:hypothetical protein
VQRDWGRERGDPQRAQSGDREDQIDGNEPSHLSPRSHQHRIVETIRGATEIARGNPRRTQRASRSSGGDGRLPSHLSPHSAIAVANVDYQELLLFHQLHPSMVSGEEAHPKAERPNLRYPLLGSGNSKFEFFQLLKSLVYSRVISFPRKSFVPHSPSHFLRWSVFEEPILTSVQSPNRMTEKYSI